MSSPHLLECTACRDLFSTVDYEDGFARWGQGEPVRLVNNPAVWGPEQPRFSLLGFSKGDTQNKAIGCAKAGRLSLSAVPFKGMRKRLGWLLDALGIRSQENIDNLFAEGEPEIRSASLIRCSISAKVDGGTYSYKLADILAADKKSGGKVRAVLERCIRCHAVPGAAGQTFIMLGLDKNLIEWTSNAFNREVGPIQRSTETTYRNATTSWVHVAHPSGNLTDPQYQKWCRGEGRKPKVLWARNEISYRLRASNDPLVAKQETP